MKIGSKSLILTLAISLIPLIAISAISISRSKKAMEESIGTNFSNLAAEKAMTIGVILRNMTAAAGVIAVSNEVKEAVRLANAKYEFMTPGEALPGIKIIDEEWIAAGRQTPTADSVLAHPLFEYLQRYQELSPGLAGETFVTDRLGVVVAMTGMISDYYQADEDWWTYSYDEGRGRVFIEDRGFDDTVGAPVVGVVLPIRDEGEVIGILKIYSKLARIIATLETLPYGEEGSVHLLRSTGDDYTVYAKGYAHKERSELDIRLMQKDTGGWVLGEHDGANQIIGYAPVETNFFVRVPTPGARKGISGEKWVPLKWFVFVEVGVATAFASINRLRNALVVFASLTGLVVIVLTFLSVRSISGPIQRLTKGVDGILKGKFTDLKLGTDSTDEVGQLSRAFDSMCGDLDREAVGRDRAEEELQVEKDTARKYLDVAGAIMVAIDASRKITMINKKGCELLGYGEDELVGKDWFEVALPEAIREEVSAAFLRIMSGEVEPLEYYENRVRTRSGDERLISWHNSVFRDAAGNITGTLSSGEDITARKRGEEELSESEEKFRQLVENINDIFWLEDKDATEMLYVSPAYERIMGRSRRSLYENPKNWIDVIHPDDRKRVKDAFLVGRLEGRYSEEYRVIRPDGSIRWIHDRGWPIRDERGEVTRVAGIAKDITEHKKSEERVLQAKLDWEGTFNTINEMITIHDEDFNIVRANKAAVDTLGLPDLKEGKVKCYKYFHASGSPPDTCPCNRCKNSGEPEMIELFAPHLDKHLEITAIPRYGSGGEFRGLIHVVRDVTERRRLEEQLRHAQKMEAIGRLTGGIAHDFNNILNIIIGHGELLQLKVGNDERLIRDVNDIVSAADRASKLTHSLLAFSRKHHGAMKPFDLNDIVKEMKKMFSVVAGVDIKMDVSLAEEPIKVTADHGQIEQVLMNFFTNARDAMPGGGTLRISTELVEFDDAFIKTHGFGTPGTHASITVKDTGIGMDDKTRASIFEPFFTTKGVGRGTGLGLAVAYGIIQQHNGHIDVRSTPGKGSTFTLYLPATNPNAVEAEAPARALPSRGTETILVAEDDLDMRELASEILTSFGYKVVEAADGEEAVKKFKRNKKRVKLLLLDVMMPGKNGREVYEEIRKLDPSIKVLFLTGYPSDIMSKEGGLEKGFDVMLKPVSMNDLLVKVRDTLDA